MHMARASESRVRAAGSTPAWIADDNRQFHRMLTAGFILFLVPASLAWLTGWRWRPWPPGPKGYGSIISEARAAASTYVPFGFMGW
jgi:light-harvesting complex 1 beta chain